MTTLNKSESAASSSAQQFLQTLQSHPPRRLHRESEMARKNLDAILPAASAARQAPQSKQDQVTAPAARRKKSELFPAAVFLTVITLAMVGLVAWSMRHAPADTFWGAVGFVAALFGGSSIVVLLGLSWSWPMTTPIKNRPLDQFDLSLSNLYEAFDD